MFTQARSESDARWSTQRQAKTSAQFMGPSSSSPLSPLIHGWVAPNRGAIGPLIVHSCSATRTSGSAPQPTAGKDGEELPATAAGIAYAIDLRPLVDPEGGYRDPHDDQQHDQHDQEQHP